ncbi:MAG: GAF domain-containing protein [Candidatus Acetothermia bacterium]
MSSETPFEDLTEEINDTIRGGEVSSEVLSEVARFLRREVDHYDWVGFYLANERDKRLTLGPFDGEPTEHTEIDYGEGVCGQAAEKEEVFTVQNVEEESNYLSCSPKVKSEIVVPIFREGAFVGEIDIDSHEAGVFTEEDEDFLRKLAGELAEWLGRG